MSFQTTYLLEVLADINANFNSVNRAGALQDVQAVASNGSLFRSTGGTGSVIHGV